MRSLSVFCGIVFSSTHTMRRKLTNYKYELGEGYRKNNNNNPKRERGKEGKETDQEEHGQRHYLSLKSSEKLKVLFARLIIREKETLKQP